VPGFRPCCWPLWRLFTCHLPIACHWPRRKQVWRLPYRYLRLTLCGWSRSGSRTFRLSSGMGPCMLDYW
jgi:hypothetical protein